MNVWNTVKSEDETEKMRSNCKKKSDEIFMDCGSNDDAVYAQARQIKQ